MISRIISIATAIALLYDLQGTSNDSYQDAIYQYIKCFQDYWSSAIDSGTFNAYCNIDYISGHSFIDEINQTILDNFAIFLLAFIIMFIYLTLTLGGEINCIQLCIYMALAALFIIFCSLLMGFGVASLFSMSLIH